MAANTPRDSTNIRLYLLAALLVLWGGGICLRLVYLQIFRYGSFEKRAMHERERTEEVSARRGIIYDRTGRELAMSISVDSAFAVPTEIPDLAGTISLISKITKTDPRETLAKCKAARTFCWVARKADAETAGRIRSMNLPPSADLDAELIRILEDRWTERMSRVAPIIGLYASDSILPRVKKVYEVYGPDWPCSIEAGLLTYFLRLDPAYGTEKLGPALSAYYDKSGSDCHQTSLLVDLALLRNGPELQPFVSAALNDPRPLVAAAGARVTAFGDQAKIPLPPLLARLRALRDEWADFDTRSSTDPEYLKKWNSGYNELERTLSIDFVNAGDSSENAVIWKQALDLCITDLCRNTLRQRLARSRF